MIKPNRQFWLKGLILTPFCILVIGILFYGINPQTEVFKEGDISPKDMYSPYTVTIQTEIDQAATNRLIKEKSEELPAFFSKSEKTIKVISENVNSIFDTATSLQPTQQPLAEKISKLKQTLGVPIIESALSTLFESENLEEIKIKTIQILNELLNNPVIKDEDKRSLKAQNKIMLLIHDAARDTDQTFPLENVLSQNDIKDFIKNLKSLSTISDPKVRQSILEIVVANIQPTVFLDNQLEKERQELLVKKITPVYKQIEIKKDELIIEKGRRFSREQISIVKELFKSEAFYVYVKKIFGLAIIVFIWTFITLFYFHVFQKEYFVRSKLFFLVFTIAILLPLMGKIIVMSGLSIYMVPVPLGTMLIGLLISPQVAFVSSFLISALSGLSISTNLTLMLIYLIGNLAAVIFIIKARRRAHVLRAGIWVGLFQGATICAFLLLQGQEIRDIFIAGSYGVIGGFLSAALTLAVLPIFEYLFGLTTDISLLELSDLNHPLLRQLAITAPGTYHHSIMVGNLAEAACDAVDAKSLLARVGSYYHDIGKLNMSRYFSENQEPDKDEHASLSPTISKIIIANHVKEGVELAQKYRLNEEIIKFVREHHGTSLMHYFYHKALENSEDLESLKEENFRYTGPRPQTKEAAIVLLADAVEAASRALHETTPVKLKELVHDIINNKFIDGQLDECNLTLRDLNKIAESFLRVLSGIFHARIEYPPNEKEKIKISIEKPLHTQQE